MVELSVLIYRRRLTFVSFLVHCGFAVLFSRYLKNQPSLLTCEAISISLSSDIVAYSRSNNTFCPSVLLTNLHIMLSSPLCVQQKKALLLVPASRVIDASQSLPVFIR